MNAPALFAESYAPIAYKPVALRPYQSRTVAWVHDERMPGARLLVVAPTGAGKTVIASQLILDELERGGRVLFCAHRQELIAQTYGTLLRRGLPERTLGVIMGDGTITHPLRRRRENCQRALAPVQVASIDTLRNRPRPAGVTLVIYDECHRSLARSYVDLAEHYAPTATLVGLTATPYRGDGRGLGAMYRELLVVAQPRELVAEGFLMEPRVFTHPVKPDLGDVRTVAGEYDQEQLGAAMDKATLVGNIVEHWKRLAGGMRTVAFATNVAHSKHIVEAFASAGVPAEHLDGTTPDDLRAGILGRLESGQTLVVSNCGVLCEGWDQPSVKAAILARPTKSTSLYIQCAGRVLRPFDGPEPIILDHAGCVLVHGLPTQDREFSLDVEKKRARARVSVKECPECFAALPSSAQVCPCCGHPFGTTDASKGAAPEEADGNLVEVDRALAAARAVEAVRKNLRGRIQAIATQVDHDNGWEPGTVNKKLFARFRKSRSEMTPEELAAVLGYLETEPFAVREAPLFFEVPQVVGW